MAAAAGGGGGIDELTNIQQILLKRIPESITTPIILSNILTGAHLIRAGIASPDEAYMWYDKFFRKETDKDKNGKFLVDNLYKHTMGPKERAARWDKFLEGTKVVADGYFNKGYKYDKRDFVGGSYKDNYSPLEYQMSQQRTYIKEHLSHIEKYSDARKQMAEWSETVSPLFYAYILYALTAPLNDGIDYTTDNNYHYVPEGPKKSQNVYLNQFAKINTGKTRGGKRRGASHKRRTSKRRQTKKRRA